MTGPRTFGGTGSVQIQGTLAAWESLGGSCVEDVGALVDQAFERPVLELGDLGGDALLRCALEQGERGHELLGVPSEQRPDWGAAPGDLPPGGVDDLAVAVPEGPVGEVDDGLVHTADAVPLAAVRASETLRLGEDPPDPVAGLLAGLDLGKGRMEVLGHFVFELGDRPCPVDVHGRLV